MKGTKSVVSGRQQEGASAHIVGEILPANSWDD